MAFQIEFLPQPAKELHKLDRTAAARIIRTLKERIANLSDPRTGRRARRLLALAYRDDCVITRIKDERITILVVRVAHQGAA